MTGKNPKHIDDNSIDTYALKNNYVTVTAVHCSLTDESFLGKLQRWKIWKKIRRRFIRISEENILNARILAIDDNILNLQILKKILTTAGFVLIYHN